MAGTWTAVPLAPFSLNATPLTGTLNAAAPSNWGYASSGTSTLAAPTAWSTAIQAVAVPNPSGNVFLWYYCGATAAGVVQVLVGEQIAGGQILPATTAQTIAASSSGWIGPLSPATYNIAERDQRARQQHRHRVDARRVPGLLRRRVHRDHHPARRRLLVRRRPAVGDAS